MTWLPQDGIRHVPRTRTVQALVCMQAERSSACSKLTGCSRLRNQGLAQLDNTARARTALDGREAVRVGWCRPANHGGFRHTQSQLGSIYPFKETPAGVVLVEDERSRLACGYTDRLRTPLSNGVW